MGKMFDRFMNTMRLNGDDYEEEYDEYDDEYDGYDDDLYDDEYDDQPAQRRSAAKKSAGRARSTSAPRDRSSGSSSRDSKIVPIRKTQNIQEVRVVCPTTFEAAKEIIDVLLDGQAAVINLEGLKNDNFPLASRITDFVFGGCYALDGNIKPVTNFIFIVTPDGLEITGDIQGVVNNKQNVSGSVYGYQTR